jgi:uncharacterized protein involved in exopolysaccharide biosynthesis
VVLRERRAVLLTLAIVLAADFCWIVFGPRSYESAAKLYVRIGRESVALDPTATLGETRNLYATQENEINSVLQILESRQIAEQVVDRIGVDVILGKDKTMRASVAGPRFRLSGLGGALGLDPESDRSHAIRRLQERVSIWAPVNSSVVGIRYEAEDPKTAQDIVSAWVDVFLKDHLRLTGTEGSFEFFTGQVESAKEELEVVERRLQEAKDQAGLVSIPGQQKVLEDRLAAIELQLTRNDLALESSRAKADDLRKKLDLLAPTIVTQESKGAAHQAWDLMRDKLYGLQMQQQELRAKYTDEHPSMAALMDQVREVEEILKSQAESRQAETIGPNPTYQFLHQALLSEEAQVTAHEAEREGSLLQRDGILQELKRLNEAAVQIGALERQLAIQETKYQSNVAKMEQARINEALDRERVSSVNVVQPATFVEKPVSPNKRLSLAAGLVLGAVAGVCLAMAKARLRPALQPAAPAIENRTVAALPGSTLPAPV